LHIDKCENPPSDVANWRVGLQYSQSRQSSLQQLQQFSAQCAPLYGNVIKLRKAGFHINVESSFFRNNFKKSS